MVRLYFTFLLITFSLVAPLHANKMVTIDAKPTNICLFLGKGFN